MASVIDSTPRELAASKDGSVALPPELLAELGWHEGDHLRVARSPDGELVLKPGSAADSGEVLSPAERVERFRQSAGKFFTGVDPVAYQRSLRDEWREPLARREHDSDDDA
ncbi:MAG TPA: AbrB/MazE/SpoVT family DNA-binding domain-containing protein [Tepidiformaceae bacterium]|nr:AbrB/MazE/SpoVT family DNA-binding domain-containing protein [Tepidiformaceae bacterium]